MSKTSLSDVEQQVQEFWSPLFMDELKEATLLPTLINKDYEGEIKKGGDTVYVSQINRPNADRRTIGAADGDSFSSAKMSTSRISIVADQRITASFEVEDVVEIQSQIGDQDSKIRQALMESLEIELNNYCYSLVAPSASAPDHTITSVTDFNAAQLNAVRKLASQAKWRKDGWWLLADPSYMSDMLNSNTLVSADFGATDAPVIAGQMARQRYNFNILEDNSDGLAGLSAGSEDAALAFHPDFMHLVMQREPTFQISSLHSQKKHGFLISVDAIVGSALGIDGAKKHITVVNS